MKIIFRIWLKIKNIYHYDKNSYYNLENVIFRKYNLYPSLNILKLDIGEMQQYKQDKFKNTTQILIQNNANNLKYS